MRNNPREHILDLHRQHVKAWERRNLDAFRTIYADNAIIFNTVPPPRFSDFKTFENTAQHYFNQLDDLTLFTSNIQIEVSGEVAWITSQYLLAYQESGRLLRQNGRWTEIYQRSNGDWKLSHFHSSPDPVSKTTPDFFLASS
jgi:ketosteroid isomerase-like protein